MRSSSLTGTRTGRPSRTTRMTPALQSRLGTYVVEHGLGSVRADSGFQLGRQPDTVRAPDVAFFATEGLIRPRPKGYYPGAPDVLCASSSKFSVMRHRVDCGAPQRSSVRICFRPPGTWYCLRRVTTL